MADENATPTSPATTTTATEPHVPKWGDPISSIPTERQEQLKKLAEEQRAWLATTDADRDPKQSPFRRAWDEQRTQPTGAEVFFLAAEAIFTEQGIALDEAELRARASMAHPALHLEGASLSWAHLEGAALAQAHLEGASLYQVHLEGANLDQAHLEGANLIDAHLEGADLSAAHLEGSNLFHAYLDGARLIQARLDGARLIQGHLEGADLFDAHLEGADLSAAHLEGAELRRAFFSTASDLADAAVADEAHGAMRVVDVRWQDVNLAVIQQWREIAMLGDEQRARALEKQPLANPANKIEPLPKGASRVEQQEARAEQRRDLLNSWRDAARANRQLASVMRDQGMNDEADRFAYRGQVCQRQVYRYSGQRGRRLGSWLLDATSGYGYHPRRSAFTYIGVVLAFAVAFFLLRASVTPALNPLDALIFSVTSFHGRGFSPGEAVTLHNPLTVLAAGEAILGLLIEITFIATFTQRFFGR